MSVKGKLVKAYLYKAEWTITYSGTGEFKLRVGNTLSNAIGVSTIVADLGTELTSILGSTGYSLSGSSSPITITLAEDYAFSGISFSVEEADATVTVSLSRKFPSSITTPTEGNGFYKLGSETSLDKNYEIETQDITSKDSEGDRETVSQIRGVSMSPTNFFTSTGNFEALRKQWELSLPVILCDITPEQYQNYAVYNMTSLSQGATVNQVVDFTAEFERTGSTTQLTS